MLTIFYALVLYTNLPISKNPDDYNHYKLLGLGGGVAFLMMPIIGEISNAIIPAYQSLSQELKSAAIVSLTIVFAIIGDIIYRYLHKKHETVVQILPQNYQDNLEVAQKLKYLFFYNSKTTSPM
jgi:hypothetical protein